MATFEMAMDEYNKENEDGQFKIIYTYFGLAIYQAQCLEETFTIMLCTNKIINKNIKTNQEINKIIDSIENSKKTMGKFIHEVKRNYNLTDEVENSLTEILKKRNYLIHKYFKLEIAKFTQIKVEKRCFTFFQLLLTI